MINAFQNPGRGPRRRTLPSVEQKFNGLHLSEKPSAMKNLGQYIVDKRKELNLKQTDLADLAEISKSYLSQIESGKKIPELNVLQRISESLEVPLNKLLIESLSDKHSLDLFLEIFQSLHQREDITEEKKQVLLELDPIVKRLANHYVSV